MTAQEISRLVQEGADKRLGDVVGRSLSILVSHHKRTCYPTGCNCKHCCSISEYSELKIALHHTRKRMRYLDPCRSRDKAKLDELRNYESLLIQRIGEMKACNVLLLQEVL